MAVKRCANCEGPIGHLEAEHRWNDHVVCRQCYERLSRPVPNSATATPSGAPGPRPRRPKVFWLAIALFVAGTVFLVLGLWGFVEELLGSQGDLEQLQRTLAKARAASPAWLDGLGLIMLCAHVVGFVMAWRGWAWGALVMIATVVPLAAVEITSGASVLGLTLSGPYLAALVLSAAGFACFLLPPAWRYYRQCAAYRLAQEAT